MLISTIRIRDALARQVEPSCDEGPRCRGPDRAARPGGAARRGGRAALLIMGSGTLTLRSRATGEQATVRYRQPDGRYDYVAFGALQRILRSKGAGSRRS